MESPILSLSDTISYDNGLIVVSEIAAIDYSNKEYSRYKFTLKSGQVIEIPYDENVKAQIRFYFHCIIGKGD